jgi:hypothetical protein
VEGDATVPQFEPVSVDLKRDVVVEPALENSAAYRIDGLDRATQVPFKSNGAVNPVFRIVQFEP